jgi:Holliday junction resolvasome RuvABC endonuclease subunit
MNNEYGKYNNETTLLSLDTSSTKTGWAIFKNGIYKESGVLDWSHVKETEDRLLLMYIDIIQHIDKYEPDILVIEKDVVGSGKKQNMSTINTLVKLIGGVWAYCIQLNIDTPMNFQTGEFIIFYKEYTPSEWRNLVGITARKREDCKTASIKRIKDVYNLNVDDNEADAINIGDAYINEWGGEE